MKYPARCNRRTCQARRNLTKRPEQYAKWPKCHKCGAGRMYVDKYRLRKGAKDNAPVCRLPYCGYYEATGRFLPHHRVSTQGCSGYADWIARRNTAPRSKHSPIPESDWVPF